VQPVFDYFHPNTSIALYIVEFKAYAADSTRVQLSLNFIKLGLVSKPLPVLL